MKHLSSESEPQIDPVAEKQSDAAAIEAARSSARPPSRMKAIAQSLKWLVGIGLLVLLLAYVDWAQTADLISRVAWLPTFFAFLLSISALVISTGKWQLLLQVQQLDFSFGSLLRYYWIGNFFTNYMPSNIGGDVVRLAIMRRYGQSGEIASSIYVERLTGFVVLLAFTALALLMRPGYYREANLLGVLWLGVAAATAATIVATVGGRRIIGLISGGLGQSGWQRKLSALLGKIVDSLYAYERRWGALLGAVIYSVPFYLVIALFQMAILRSFGVDIQFRETLFIAPAIIFVSMLPISPNAIGVAEGIFVLLYVQAGIDAEVALAAALMRRLIDLAVSLVGGALWMFGKQKAAGGESSA